MGKFGLIARYEYLKNVRRRAFLLVTFGLPVVMIAMMALSIYGSDSSRGDEMSIGYVDQSGVLAAAKDNPGFRSFVTPQAARAELESGRLKAFYVLPAGYPASAQAQLFYWDRQPSSVLLDRFGAFLKANLVAGLDPGVAARAITGPTDVVVRSADGNRQSEGRGLVAIILPFALGLFISIALMTASGYLLRAIGDEKENRTIEIMATSVSPEELIAGKAAGLIAVALTQVLLWAIVVVGGVSVASLFVDFLSGIHISWGLVLVLAAYFVPLFALAAGLVVVVGVAVTDIRQGQQITGTMSFLYLLPLFFSPLLGSNPDAPAMIALSLFPTTSLLTVAIRWGATLLPAWQLVLGWVILALSAGGTLWAAPKVFRQGMLRYGQRMSLRSVVGALRART